MQALEQLDLVGTLLGEVVGNITEADLDNKTPCVNFTVEGVLAHMIGGGTMFAATFRGDTDTPEVPSGPVLEHFGPAMTGLFEAMHAPGAMERTVQAPFGPVPGETFARFVALDGLVHGYDMAVATGQPYNPPAALVEAAIAFGTEAIEPLRDGDTFAQATTPPPDATPIQRLAALTGRQVTT